MKRVVCNREYVKKNGRKKQMIQWINRFQLNFQFFIFFHFVYHAHHFFALVAKIKMQNYSLARKRCALEIETFTWIQLVALKIFNIYYYM